MKDKKINNQNWHNVGRVNFRRKLSQNPQATHEAQTQHF